MELWRKLQTRANKQIQMLDWCRWKMSLLSLQISVKWQLVLYVLRWNSSTELSLSNRPCNVSVDDSLLLLKSPWLWTSGTLGTPWAHTRGKLSRHIPRVDTKGCAVSGLVSSQYPGLWLAPAPAPMLVTKRQSTSELVQQLSPGSGGGYLQMRPVICAWQTEHWHDIMAF